MLPSSDVMRLCVFERDTVTLIQDQYSRRRGRPKNTGGPQVYNLAVRLAGSVHSLERIGSLSPEVWRRKVRSILAN